MSFWSEEYFQQYSRGVDEGERRAEELWRQRSRKNLVVGILIGIAVGVVGYIEILSTVGLTCNS